MSTENYEAVDAIGADIPATTPSTHHTKRKRPVAEVEKTGIICTPQVFQEPLTVLVVGAGGNGARVIPPITQMLRRRDRLFIMDHDIVEDRNLARQHFTEADIGSQKAVVLAHRYRKRDMHPVALVSKLTLGSAEGVMREIGIPPMSPGVIIGCADNNAARNVMASMMLKSASPMAYIDVGNERRGGQVLMSLRMWPLLVPTPGGPYLNKFTMNTIGDAMPQLCRPAPWICDDCVASNPATVTVCQQCGREAGTCGNRMDVQTVMVNHMAAGMVLNCLSWLMLGIPFTAAGAFFSTLNTMQPIMIKYVDTTVPRLYVDTSFALDA